EHRRQEQDRADDREEREEIRAVRMPGHLRELHTIVGFERRRDERRDEIRERSEHERGAEGDERQRFRIAERHGFLLRLTDTTLGRGARRVFVREDEPQPPPGGCDPPEPALASGTMRNRLPRAAAIDVGIVALCIALTELEIWISDDVPGPRLGRALPLLLVLVVPLLLRRRAPFAVTALVFGGVVAYSVWHGSPEGLELIGPVTVAAYSVAAHAPRPRAVAGLALFVACYAVYAAYDPNVTQHGRAAAENEWAAAFFGAALVAVWLLGVFVRSRREAAHLATRSARAEREAELAVAEERARMARELHDIVSHNLSVVVLQAAGARAAGANATTLEKIER